MVVSFVMSSGKQMYDKILYTQGALTLDRKYLRVNNKTRMNRRLASSRFISGTAMRVTDKIIRCEFLNQLKDIQNCVEGSLYVLHHDLKYIPSEEISFLIFSGLMRHILNICVSDNISDDWDMPDIIALCGIFPVLLWRMEQVLLYEFLSLNYKYSLNRIITSNEIPHKHSKRIKKAAKDHGIISCATCHIRNSKWMCFRRIEFKRCKKCKSTWYCSKKCQKWQWNKGIHRAICKYSKEGDFF